METHSHTRALAEYLHGMTYDGLGSHGVEVTKMCVEDFIGVAVAGSSKPASQIWRDYYAPRPPRRRPAPFSRALDGTRWSRLPPSTPSMAM